WMSTYLWHRATNIDPQPGDLDAVLTGTDEKFSSSSSMTPTEPVEPRESEAGDGQFPPSPPNEDEFITLLIFVASECHKIFGAKPPLDEIISALNKARKNKELRSREDAGSRLTSEYHGLITASFSPEFSELILDFVNQRLMGYALGLPCLFLSAMSLP